MRNRAGVAFACLLALVPRPSSAETRWTLLRGQNVTVFGDQSAGTLRDLAVQLAQFRVVLGNLLAGARQPLSAPPFVHVFTSRRGMQPFLPLYKGHPAAIAGYAHTDEYDCSFIALSTEGFEDSSRVLFHEYTHLLVRQAAGRVPLWLNEGLAEFYSTYRLAADGRSADIGRPIPPHVQRLRESFVPVAQLIAVDETSDLYNEGERRSIFYAESWAAAHYLITEFPDGGGAINRYVREIDRGRPPVEAFTTAFGLGVAEFEKQLLGYVHRPSFKYGSFRFTEAVQVEEPERARVVPQPEAEARLGLLQLQAGRTDEAAPRIEAAAAADPASGLTQLALGALRLRQERNREAWPILERAARQAPDDFFVQYVFGSAIVHAPGGPEGVALSRDPREAAYDALKAATRLNPTSAEAHALLAYTSLLLQTRLAEAGAAIARAVALAPARLGYRLRLAEAEAAIGNIDRARELLTELSAVTTDTYVATAARTQLQRIEEALRARDAPAAEPQRPPVSVEVPRASEEPPPPRFDEQPEPMLRKPRAGEERAYGSLTRVDCSPSQVAFHLKVGDRTIVAVAKRIDDVQLTSFVGDKDFAVACGPHAPAEAVYLTWRMRRGPDNPAAQVVGDAVAVEFVPRGYAPR